MLFPLGKAWAWRIMSVDPGVSTALSVPVALGYAAAGAVVGSCLVGLWACFLRMDSRKVNSWWLGAALLAIIGLAIDFGLRRPDVQDAVWGAAQARLLRHDDYFMRTMAMFRRATRFPVRGDEAPGIKIIGGSQLLWGVDLNDLRAAFPQTPVQLYAVASLYPVRILQAQEAIPLKAGDLAVLYWSELDMVIVRALDAERWRPVANEAGLKEAVNLFPCRTLLREWRSLLDYGLATQSELWRDREGLRTLLTRPLGVTPETELSHGAEALFRVGSDYRIALQDEEALDRSLRAAGLILADWSARGIRTLVLEGQLSGYMDQPETPAVRQRTQKALRELCASYPNARYISAEQQTWRPTPHDWRDATHLNEAARAGFTAYLAREIADGWESL